MHASENATSRATYFYLERSSYTKDKVSSQDILERIQLDDLAKVLRNCELQWHGHVECSNGWLNKVQSLNPTGRRGRGHPKKTWTEVIDMDHLALGLSETHPFDRKD